MTDVAWATLSVPGAPSAASPAALAGLWDSRGRLEAGYLAQLPYAARRYLEHAVAPDTVLATCVKLQMHGEIKLKKWRRFTGTQIIHRYREFAWRVRSRMYGLPVHGFDKLIGGNGAMQWNAFGVLPLVRGSGAAVTRSAAARAIAESVWLPSSLCTNDVTWTGLTERHPHAYIASQGQWVALELTLGDTGGVQKLSVMRWAPAKGGGFHYFPFGAIVEDEATFHGYTIPTRLRMGYFVGTPQFASEGEFLRIAIDNATFV